jgi:hypothetical protein
MRICAYVCCLLFVINILCYINNIDMSSQSNRTGVKRSVSARTASANDVVVTAAAPAKKTTADFVRSVSSTAAYAASATPAAYAASATPTAYASAASAAQEEVHLTRAQIAAKALMNKSLQVLFPMGAPLCASVSVCTRFNNIMGITSCCYNALKLYFTRCISNKIYPNSEDEPYMKITENQLYELISTSINFGSILNIVPNQGTQSLGDAIRSESQNHAFDDRLISNVQWCYEAFTSQFGRQGEKIKSYAYSYIPQAMTSEEETSEDDYIDVMVKDMFERSWLGPIPFVLMCRDEPDHWFAIHCSRIISTWGIGDASVDIKFDATFTTPGAFANFIKSIKNPAALDFFKDYLKQTMLNFKNARSATTTEDKINAYVDFYEGPLREGKFDVCEIFDTQYGRSVETILNSIHHDLGMCDLLLTKPVPRMQRAVAWPRTQTNVLPVKPPDTPKKSLETSSLLFGEEFFTPSSRNALISSIAGPRNCSTRLQDEKISNCGIINSCNIVKSLLLIYTAVGSIRELNDTTPKIIGDINKLLYATIDLSLLEINDGDNLAVQGSLYYNMHNILTKLGINTKDFIDRLKFLQEFTIINIPQPIELFIRKGLQPVSFGKQALGNNFDGEHGIGAKMQLGKEYFILCSFNPTTGLLSAVHYFICGRSESASTATASASASGEPVTQIYSAWASDNVKNTYSTTPVSIYEDDRRLPNFRDFAKSIEMQEAGTEPDGLRAFLMATMLNPDNEEFGTQTLKQIKDHATSSKQMQRLHEQRADAEARINLEIATITERKLVLCTVPNYLTTLTSFIHDGSVRAGGDISVFELFDVESCSSMSAEALEIDRYAVDEPAQQSEDYDGGARPRRNKITRRLIRHNRGKTMKRPRANKRRTNKVQTQRMVKRKKSKSIKLSRRHIVKK